MIDKFGRPDWDSWFIALCFVISQKSIDPRTKHGAILVSKDHRILSIGYNGPIRNSLDTNIPINDEKKYPYLLHSEENCLLNYNGSQQDLDGATLYITGKFCHRCLRMILQKGIKNIVIGPVKSACKDEEDEKACENMLVGQKVKIREYVGGIDSIFDLLDKTKEYIKAKVENNEKKIK
jgi:dCMP deaminase